tara:strand:- start:1645 stop:2382 length:738 start_codon:yes stop_codon:yes gene_type:complete
MDDILIEDTKNVRIIQFNRPQKLNAINLSMYKALQQTLHEGEQDPDVHVFFIKGQAQGFTAGHDLQDFLQGQNLSATHPTVAFLYQLLQLKKPLIAAVSGHAIGIGTTLLLHCDMVYASDDAQFQLPFVNLNLVPEAACSYLLPQLCGLQKASELLMLGDPFGAQQAKEIGLVNHIVQQETLDAYAFEKASQLAQKPQEALIQTKALLRSTMHKQAQVHLEQELKQFAEHLTLPATKERLQRFFS